MPCFTLKNLPYNLYKDQTITDLQGQIQAEQREILSVQEGLTRAQSELTQKDQDFQASRTAYQEQENQLLDLKTQLSTAQQTLTAERNKLTETIASLICCLCFHLCIFIIYVKVNVSIRNIKCYSNWN